MGFKKLLAYFVLWQLSAFLIIFTCIAMPPPLVVKSVEDWIALITLAEVTSATMYVVYFLAKWAISVIHER